ncbi:MAG TPA: hypothetical protein IGS52_12630 [Oscillatoriaceae cyanobacterium M33_DOE_052]|nr:hypothetical protein [Oscillatoriaceae cyanobacterium M33_DOE_052]
MTRPNASPLLRPYMRRDAPNRAVSLFFSPQSFFSRTAADNYETLWLMELLLGCGDRRR